MRILIWTDAFWPEIGGLENFCLNLCRGLEARGHEILIVTERKDHADMGWSEIGRLRVFGVCFELAGKRKDLELVRRQHEVCGIVIADFRPDIIHLNSVMRGTLGFLLQQRGRRFPAIMTLHDNLFPRYERGMAPAVLDNVDAIVAVSRSVAEGCMERLPQLAPRLHTIHNALPLPAIAPAPFPPEVCLLAYGRLVRDKGFDLAIEAFQSLAPEFSGLTLTIAGDGREAESLHQLALKSGFSGRILFPGWVAPDDVPVLLNQHSVVIMPSRWREPFGLVALEAAQMGRPIVCAATGALPEIVVDGETGLLFENENSFSLAQAIRKLLERPETGRQLGAHARNYVSKNFDFEKFLASYEDVYSHVISR